MRSFLDRLVFLTIPGLLIVVSRTALRTADPPITGLSTPTGAAPVSIAENVLRLPQDSGALMLSRTCSGATTWTSTSITVTVPTPAMTGPNRKGSEAETTPAERAESRVSRLGKTYQAGSCQDSSRGWVFISSGGSRRAAIYA